VPELQRFVDAQDAGGTYDTALAELRAGRKRSHWMWFVLPQLSGLGRSSMAQRYALSGLEEARAYLAHPVLGPRLRACAEALLGLPVPDAEQVLGCVGAQVAVPDPDQPRLVGARRGGHGGRLVVAGHVRRPNRAGLDGRTNVHRDRHGAVATTAQTA
jgi:hypothetical protein